MKKQFFGLLLLLSVGGAAFSQGSAAKKILPFPIQQKKLANGLNVVTVPFNSPGLASLYIVVRAGAREEVEAGKTGFAHFFEHVMFRGTEKYSKEAYDVALKSIGASANANTTQDRTLYHMTGNAGKLEKMFELEGDRFQNLKYSEHDFKTEAGAVKGEYTKNSASPYQQLYEKTLNTAFDKHTYKHTTMGFFADVVDMPNQYNYSLTFFDRFYRPEYTTIVVVGDVKQQDVNRYAEKYFGNWKPGNYKPVIEAEPPQTGTRYAHVNNPSFPPYLSLNYKGPAFSDRSVDLAALNILSTYLFAESSDLYQQLVVKEQKVRSLGGGAGSTRDAQLITIAASVVNAADLQYVKDALVKALEEAKSKTVNAKLLADTKSLIKYSFAMRLDSPDQIANTLAQAIWLTGNPEAINNFYALFDKVTAADIMNVAKKYFTPDALTIATIGPGEQGSVK
ncbi:insulinase family protein [Segetibacter sp. 3557_3]|uniref:M16 family metallopeptidase n=1 Tax=Segetibacter sp. 3557_3 TaxID=2547429 RepID=UPI00105856FA|nr:pitrilysin family protein [Segetibacter sp. 3557_3]TDH20641.1 insulinase family protein [Segetibacter sp. 3557_3]